MNDGPRKTYHVDLTLHDGTTMKLGWETQDREDREGYGRPSGPMLDVWIERFEDSTRLKIEKAVVSHRTSGNVVVQYPFPLRRPGPSDLEPL